ncbi:MAG TPA: winged helix-turn-helix domain-containing protein [Bacteroidales bacterium]|nr:winged helix-turn-helix domain-containing protein [Bacteroidales bacterium]
MNNKIGTNAGKIWNYLYSTKECPIEELSKQLDMNDRDLCLALGWLAHGENLVFNEKGGVQYVALDF